MPWDKMPLRHGVVKGGEFLGSLLLGDRWMCRLWDLELRMCWWSLAVCGWAEGDISALYDESRDQSVEWCVVICATRAEGKEVLCGLGASQKSSPSGRLGLYATVKVGQR